MSLAVFILVLGSALLHASWNALVKRGHDKLMSMAAIVTGHMPFALAVLVFVPLPSLKSVPYIFVSMIMHAGYQLFLLNSYKIGDLTQVYPVARGSAPLIVTLLSFVILGIKLDFFQYLSILVIIVGICSFTFVQNSKDKSLVATRLALTTGLFIALYSLIDGLGARVSGSPWGFYSCLTIGNGIVAMIYLMFHSRRTFHELYHNGRKLFIVGGGASFLSYGLVTWAFTKAPIALVSALRETSIVFALFIGVFFLKERLNIVKIFATAVTVIGIILLRFSGVT